MMQPQPVPCPPPWYRPASECFDQVKQFEEMIEHMVDTAVYAKLKQLYQQGALPPGVVDGSDAQPGQVGEFITGTATMSYAAYPTDTIVTIPGIVMPPGDWNITASLGFSTIIGGSIMYVDPVPAGLSNSLSATLSELTGEFARLIGTPARGNFTVPTLLPFKVGVTQSISSILPAGTGYLLIEARRAR